MKQSRILTIGNLQEYIREMDTCTEKGQLHLQDMDKLEERLHRRREDWSKMMFRCSSQEALLDEVEKLLKDHMLSQEVLAKKTADIEKQIKVLEDVVQCMSENPDYALKMGALLKLKQALADYKAKKEEIRKQMQGVQGMLNRLKEAKDKGLSGVSVENLQSLARIGEEAGDILAKENKKADQIMKDLAKKRHKLGDADIFDNLKTRVDSINKMTEKIRDVESEQQELTHIMQEAARINPSKAKDA